MIDIDCINQLVEVDDTLLSFTYIYILIFTNLIDLYWKIH